MNPTTPNSSEAQPYAGLSEFELPSRVRDLAARIMGELISPCRQQLANAEAKFQEARDERLKQRNSFQSRTNKLLGELERISLAAKNHLQSQNVSIGSPSAPIGGAAVPPVQDISAAVREAETLKQHLNFLCAKTIPPFWPKDKTARWVIAIASIILWAAIPLHLVGLLIYPTVVIIAKIVLTKTIKRDYHRLDKWIQKLRFEIQPLEIHPHKEYESAEQKAVESHQKILQEIEEAFRNESQSLHDEADRLWKDSVYAGADWDSSIWQNWSPNPSPEFAAGSERS